MIAALLTQVGNGISQQAGVPLRMAPPTADDPRGAGLAASALPITLAGMLPAIAMVLLLKCEVWTRFTAVVVFSGLAALTIAALLRYVLGSMFGRVGLAIGSLLALLLGNPLSGLNSAPEPLPTGWGALGQLFPQGANATLLRSTAFFDGAGATTAVVVLICWALAGTVLVAAAALRQGRSAPA
jgi:hypothetical protein